MDEKLLNKLKEELSSFNSIAELLGITQSNASIFWKEIIQLMKDLNKPTTGINEDDQNKILDFIQQYCDLPDKEIEEIYVSYIYDAIMNVIKGIDKDGDYWNKSMQDLLSYYYTNFQDSNNEDNLLGGSVFSKAHLKNANAGLSFKKSPWVEPNFNIDGDYYDEVRGHDEVNDILRNRHKMQYTNTQDQMEIDGQGAYSQYKIDKIYPYPFLRSEPIIIVDDNTFNSSDRSQTNFNYLSNLDQIVLAIFYDIYNTQNSTLKSLFCSGNYNSSQINDYINSQYNGNLIADFDINIIYDEFCQQRYIQTFSDYESDRDFQKMNQFFYKYLESLFTGSFQINGAARQVLLFYEWIVENQEKILEKYKNYPIQINIQDYIDTYGVVCLQILQSYKEGTGEAWGKIYADYCVEQGYTPPDPIVIRQFGNEDQNYTKNDDALDKWLRLLMPQYGRRIEIEDLNRNFWVIAQVIAAISNFLFDDTSPIVNLFKNISDEILQLWENVLYLWIEVAVTSQTATADTVVLAVPLPNDEWRPWRKYDDFDQEISDVPLSKYNYYGFEQLTEKSEYFRVTGVLIGGIFPRIESYAKKYCNKNLIIIPIERMSNYRQNFYCCEYYPEIWCYHCGTQKWKQYVIQMHLQNGVKQEWGEDFDIKKCYVLGCPISVRGFDDSEISEDFYYNSVRNNPMSLAKATGLCNLEDYIRGFSIEEDGYYLYSPCREEPLIDDDDDEEKVYYGAVRCVPNVSYEIEVDDIKITDFSIDIYDAAGTLRIGEGYSTTPIARIVLEDDTIFGDEIGIVEETDVNYSIVYCKMEYLAEPPSSQSVEKIECVNTVTKHNSLYLGEVASYYPELAKRDDELGYNGLFFTKIIRPPSDDEEKRASEMQGLYAGQTELEFISSYIKQQEKIPQEKPIIIIDVAGSNSVSGYNISGDDLSGYSYFKKYSSSGKDDELIYDESLKRYDVYHESTDGTIGLEVPSSSSGDIKEYRYGTIDNRVFNAKDFYEYYGYDTSGNLYYSELTQLHMYNASGYPCFGVGEKPNYFCVNYLVYIHQYDSDSIIDAFLIPMIVNEQWVSGSTCQISSCGVDDLNGTQRITGGSCWLDNLDLGEKLTMKTAGSSVEYYRIKDLTSLNDSRLNNQQTMNSLSTSIKNFDNNDSGFFTAKSGDIYTKVPFLNI